MIVEKHFKHPQKTIYLITTNYSSVSFSLLAAGTGAESGEDSKGGGALRSCLWFSSSHLSISSIEEKGRLPRRPIMSSLETEVS